MFSGIGALPKPATESHVVKSGWEAWQIQGFPRDFVVGILQGIWIYGF